MIPNIPVLVDPKLMPQFNIRDFGERFVNSKYGRPYRRKNRKFRSNFRSGNKKKLIY